MTTATTEETTRADLAPAIAAVLRDYADQLSAEARGGAVDADDLDALQRRVKQLREPVDIREIADRVDEESTQAILSALHSFLIPF